MTTRLYVGQRVTDVLTAESIVAQPDRMWTSALGTVTDVTADHVVIDWWGAPHTRTYPRTWAEENIVADPRYSPYRTAEGGFVKDAPYWTVAYRRRRANRFLRVDLALSWSEARELSAKFVTLCPDLEVWYVTNLAAERDGYTSAEDAGSILVDSGRRVRIVEGGKLPQVLSDKGR